MVFGAAALARGAIGPIKRETAKPEHTGEEEMEMSVRPVGRAIAADGHRLELARRTLLRGGR